MSMAPRDAKCSSKRSNCAGQVELMQRMSAWSSSRTHRFAACGTVGFDAVRT